MNRYTLIFSAISKCSLLLLVLMFFGSPLLAQVEFQELRFQAPPNEKKSQYILTGKVTHAETGEPISGVSVHIDGFYTGVNTDEFGQYFTTLDSGRHRIVFRQLGKTAAHFIVHLYGDGVLNAQINNLNFDLETFTVLAEKRDMNIRRSIIGMTKMSIAEMKLIPALGGEPDVFNVLQTLPGVTSVGEGSAGMNIRGGQADQNQIMMNEAIVLSNNHAMGFLSPFNGDVVQDFTLYKGTVPSYYGGRSASALNIEMKKGSLEHWKYTGSLGTAVSKFLIEGPIRPEKTSIIAGGRRSNANWMLRSVEQLDINSSNIRFHDLYAGIYHKFSEKHTLDLNLLNTGDFFSFSDRFGFNWNNMVSSLTSKNLLSQNFSLIGLVAYGQFENSFFEPVEVDPVQITNGLHYYQGKISALWDIDKFEIQFGAEGLLYQMAPETVLPYTELSGRLPQSMNKQRGREWAPFASIEWNPDEKFSLVAGMRYSMYSQLGPDTVFTYQPGLPISRFSITGADFISEGSIVDYSGFEPRISFRWTFNEVNAIKGGYSSMYQYLQTISNTTGPTPIDLWQVSTTYIPPLLSHNFSLGYFKNLQDNEWSASIEGFYRKTENQLDYRDFANLYQNPHLETELVQGEGQAYGGELMIQKTKGAITGWLAYTYSRSLIRTLSEFGEIQTNRGEWYPTNFDRPHILSVVTTFHMGRNRSLNTNINYSTGRPVSAIISNYLVSGITVPHFGDRNQYRIPNYFRFDLSYMTNGMVRTWEDRINFSIYNLLGRRNAYSVFYLKERRSPRMVPYKISILGAMLPTITYTVVFSNEKKQ